MSEIFLIEIEAKSGCQEFNGAWKELQRDTKVKKAIEDGIVLNLFKISGENKVLVVVKCDGDVLDDFTTDHFSAFSRLKEGSQQSITTLVDYEVFSTKMAELAGEPKTYETIPSIADGPGLHFVLDIKIEYRGLKQDEFFKIWALETQAAMGAKKLGIAINVWKRAGERRLLALLRVDCALTIDSIVFDLPMMKQMGDQMDVTAKRMTKFKPQ